jgi:hypothetical protein
VTKKTTCCWSGRRRYKSHLSKQGRTFVVPQICTNNASPSNQLQLADATSEKCAVELIGAAETMRQIAAVPRALDLKEDFGAKITFTHVGNQDGPTSYPAVKGQTAIEAVGTKECIVSLKSPVHNPNSLVDISTVFSRASAWYEALQKKLECTGQGT